MLVWEVVNDGEAYKDRSHALILPETMQELRKSGGLVNLAYDVCLTRIRERHGEDNSRVRRVVLEALQDALQKDPLARPSALALLVRLQKSFPDEKLVGVRWYVGLILQG